VPVVEGQKANVNENVWAHPREQNNNSKRRAMVLREIVNTSTLREVFARSLATPSPERGKVRNQRNRSKSSKTLNQFEQEDASPLSQTRLSSSKSSQSLSLSHQEVAAAAKKRGRTQ
jgi:flagellar hook-basal body complex protein FliE